MTLHLVLKPAYLSSLFLNQLLLFSPHPLTPLKRIQQLLIICLQLLVLHLHGLLLSHLPLQLGNFELKLIVLLNKEKLCFGELIAFLGILGLRRRFHVHLIVFQVGLVCASWGT